MKDSVIQQEEESKSDEDYCAFCKEKVGGQKTHGYFAYVSTSKLMA